LDQPGLHGRHRDKDGEFCRKHGNTMVSTLRKIYGATFATGFPAHRKLSEVLQAVDEPSLSALVHDHDQGTLFQKISNAEWT